MDTERLKSVSFDFPIGRGYHSVMLEVLMVPVRTLGHDAGAAVWAMVVFGCGFALAFPVVRLQVKSLLVVPARLLRLARKYLRPELSPVFLFSFILCFNTAAIFIYMLSGGFVFLPLVFDLFTGLNVGAVMLIDARRPMEALDEAPGEPAQARAWVGFLSLFVVVVELTAFWLAIGMGIKLGHTMRADFGWATFIQAAGPRIIAYVIIIVPALAASAAAETAAIKAMLRGGE